MLFHRFLSVYLTDRRVTGEKKSVTPSRSPSVSAVSKEMEVSYAANMVSS